MTRSLMIKPAGARCNLSCRYCYYLDKEPLLKETSYAGAIPQADAYIWHGGEPTLLPLDYFREMVRRQRQQNGGEPVMNSLQTNGTRLTPDWCRFLHDEGWLVGISIDGPADLHDAYRRTRGGEATHSRVMRSIELLQQYDVAWNAMAVIHHLNVCEPERFYRFFHDIGCQYLQFAPIVEQQPGAPRGEVTPESISPEAWGDFCCRLFDEWLRQEDVGRLFVQLFDAVLAGWVGVEPPVCIFDRSCGGSPVMEHNGDIYPCDHFVTPDLRLGNLRDRSLDALLLHPRQQAFAAAKEGRLPRQCRECEWLTLCWGECPKNRLLNDRYGNPDLNCLCAGYRRFFAHSAEVMRNLAAALNG